jgi:dTDP-4-amino-4,6-dideoxygalactose transaminase
MTMTDFNLVNKFESQVAEFFGAPYAVATDSCTHGIELCLRKNNYRKIVVPVRTYLSVPFLANKLNIELEWSEEEWEDYYYLGGTNVIDAAVLWKENSYIDGTYMCISFQYQKHLSLGRGGMILLDDKQDAEILKKMSYDGRLPNIPWRDQNIDTFGYHYYMTPETALLGINKLSEATLTQPRKWAYTDWPDLREMDIFK